MTKPVIQTTRLVLREMTPDDLDFVAMMLADPLVMRYYPKCYSREEAEGWLNRILQSYADHGHSFWLVSLRESGELIGQVGLMRQVIDGRAEDEIGYLIHHPFWQMGYASEAAAAVRDYAFGVLRKQRVISLIRPVNVPSQRVALRIGLKQERQIMFKELEHLLFSQSGVGGNGRIP